VKIKTPIEQRRHAEMLATVDMILKKHKIRSILTNSALLGAHRDGEMIAHCQGAVLSTFYDDIKQVEKKILSELKKAGFAIVKHFNDRNYKIRVEKHGLNIEIVGYSFDGKNYYRQLHNKIKVIPGKYFNNFGVIKLHEHIYTCPSDIEGFLSFLYKDWKKKIVSPGSPSAYKSKKHMVIK